MYGQMQNLKKRIIKRAGSYFKQTWMPKDLVNKHKMPKSKYSETLANVANAYFTENAQIRLCIFKKAKRNKPCHQDSSSHTLECLLDLSSKTSYKEAYR
jgi:hypothetical protein